MERALIITVDLHKPACRDGDNKQSGRREEWTAQERSRELGELAVSAGANVIEELIVNRDRIEPAHYIGKGKVEEIAQICADESIKIVIFNNDLTGSQQKNLEEIIKTKIIDRTQLILDIFAARAHSNEGKLQVELARLLYMLPRLTGKGVEMSRPGGGIGTSGPGEQKLEVDRRRIRARINRLEKELENLRGRRAMMRKRRERFSMPTIAIVGYTNVGKSTLLNSLTNSGVMVQDKLFSTLDPTVRKFILPDRRTVLFVDTVGFLDRLPHNLVEAFKATLEEVVESDLILHLIDISHPKAKEQSDAVYKVLEEIGAKGKPIITALNKIDKVENKVLIEKALAYFTNAIPISALTREGFGTLINVVEKTLKFLQKS